MLPPLKNHRGGSCQLLDFAKPAFRYLALFFYDFCHRLNLHHPAIQLVPVNNNIKPRPHIWLRSSKLTC